MILRKNLVDTESQTPAITLHVSVSSDIRRRNSRFLQPRFALAAGQISLAEWEVGPFEGALSTIERTREKAKRDLLSKLRQLDGSQFESFLEVLFTRMGYDVTVTGGGGDNGIDLVAELYGGVGVQRVGIQAKCLGPKRSVGPNVVRLLRDALSSKQCNAGVVVATCGFEEEANRVADEPGKPPVELIAHEALLDLAVEYEVGIRTEPVAVYSESIEAVFSEGDRDALAMGGGS